MYLALCSESDSAARLSNSMSVDRFDIELVVSSMVKTGKNEGICGLRNDSVLGVVGGQHPEGYVITGDSVCKGFGSGPVDDGKVCFDVGHVDLGRSAW